MECYPIDYDTPGTVSVAEYYGTTYNPGVNSFQDPDAPARPSAFHHRAAHASTYSSANSSTHTGHYGIIPRDIQHMIEGIIDAIHSGWNNPIAYCYKSIYSKYSRDYEAILPKLVTYFVPDYGRLDKDHQDIILSAFNFPTMISLIRDLYRRECQRSSAHFGLVQINIMMNLENGFEQMFRGRDVSTSTIFREIKKKIVGIDVHKEDDVTVILTDE
jgi:hypothetical protein